MLPSHPPISHISVSSLPELYLALNCHPDKTLPQSYLQIPTINWNFPWYHFDRFPKVSLINPNHLFCSRPAYQWVLLWWGPCAAGTMSKERFSKEGLWVRQVSLKCQIGGIIKQRPIIQIFIMKMLNAWLERRLRHKNPPLWRKWNKMGQQKQKFPWLWMWQSREKRVFEKCICFLLLLSQITINLVA